MYKQVYPRCFHPTLCFSTGDDDDDDDEGEDGDDIFDDDDQNFDFITAFAIVKMSKWDRVQQ